jgi:hypothetical protein
MRRNALNVYGDKRLASIGLTIPGSEKEKAPGAGAPDAEMARILDGLTRVNEDEKAADGVMVGFRS